MAHLTLEETRYAAGQINWEWIEEKYRTSAAGVTAIAREHAVLFGRPVGVRAIQKRIKDYGLQRLGDVLEQAAVQMLDAQARIERQAVSGAPPSAVSTIGDIKGEIDSRLHRMREQLAHVRRIHEMCDRTQAYIIQTLPTDSAGQPERKEYTPSQLGSLVASAGTMMNARIRAIGMERRIYGMDKDEPLEGADGSSSNFVPLAALNIRIEVVHRDKKQIDAPNALPAIEA